VGEWKKSSFCRETGCVEVQVNVQDGIPHVGVRNPVGAETWFTPEEWLTFLEGVKNGEFDLPEGVNV